MPKLKANILPALHLNVFEKCLSMVLSTDLAKRTFSQIIDGLPTCDVYSRYNSHYRREDIGAHTEPCPDSIEAFKRFREVVNPSVLDLDSKALQSYQSSSVDSESFNLQLLKLVAIACHDIAALLFDNIGDNCVHLQQRESFLPPAVPTSNPFNLQPVYQKPTDFYHPAYTAWDQYPRGISDGVGYWAEGQLFGGVVLFDRGESGEECRSAFIHRPEPGWRIFELSESQVLDFVRFGAGEPEADQGSPQPIPFMADKWAKRVDPFDSMGLHIYRHKYERKPVPANRRPRCVTFLEDDPGMKDALKDYMSRNPRPR